MTNKKTINVQMTQAELTMWKAMQTMEGRLMLSQFEAKVEKANTEIAEMKQERDKMLQVANGFQYAADKNKRVIRPLLENDFFILETNGVGLIESVTPLTNDVELNAAELDELKALDEIAYEMYRDNALPSANNSREAYEHKHAVMGKPITFAEEMSLANGETVSEKVATERCRVIDFTVSEDYRKNCKQKAMDLTTKIHTVEASIGAELSSFND